MDSTESDHEPSGDQNGIDYAAIVNELIEQRIPPMHSLGIRVDALVPSVAEGSAPFAGNGNHIDTMYAGALFALAEMLGGALFYSNFDSHHFYPTVKSLTIEFIRPARSDITGRARLDPAEARRLAAVAERDGKAEFIIETELFDAAAVLVARTVGTYQLRTAHTAANA
ncbi:MAG: YiiD C-terminal domain-containing protein [Actinomycetota bacterium]